MNSRVGALLVGILATAAACSTGQDALATVDGATIEADALDRLHVDPDQLDDDERASTVLLLILRQGFLARADAELGVDPAETQVDDTLAAQLDRLAARGDVDEVMAALNETEARFRINAELDVVRDLVGRHLVTTETGGFDLQAAEQAYLLANAEVCVRQIQLAEGDELDASLARVAGGEGDLGCAAPNALPSGLAEASLTSALGQPTGPITSDVGVHVLEVYERTEPDLEANHLDVVETAVPVQGPELFRLWAVGVLQDIEVDIDGSVGRWAVLPETEPVPTVVPPDRFADIVEG